MRLLVLALTAPLVVACGGRTIIDASEQDGDDDGGHGPAPTGSSSGGSSSGGDEPGGGSSSGGSSSGGDDGWTGEDWTDTGEGDPGFIQEPDGGCLVGGQPGARCLECDSWAQDCPDGEKCTVWANDGGGAWNANRCVPIAPDPKQPGEPCTAEGSPVSGVDDCDIGSMCWAVDPATLEGYCVQFCTGTPDSPMCPEGFQCPIYSDGILHVCLPNCDPLLQDCRDGEACYPVNDDFQCAPDASGDGGAAGDPCDYVNSCDPGLACISREFSPGCMGSVGCCSEYCDLDAVDPEASCSQRGEGSVCMPWYDEGFAPPGYENVGICALPP